jgi:RecB family exonuclease
MRISYSQFRTYQRCPHAYWLQYVQRVPVPVPPELHFGAAVHDALHRMYDPGQLQMPSLEEVIDAFIQSWRGRESQVAEEKRGPYFEEGVNALRMHYEKHCQREEGRRTAATELSFSVELSGSHSLSGRIDRVDVLPERKLEVIDYKTSRRMQPVTVLENDAQLAIYRMAAGKLYPGFEITTALFFLLHDYQMEIAQTEQFLAETKDDILDAIVSIELQEFDPRPGTHCEWCAYRAHCLLFRAPVEPDNLDIDIAAALREYAEADTAGKEADARKDQAKELINRYLDQCQAERVEQSGYLAERRAYKRVTRWDIERLREILAPLGKWDAVTQVNTTALRRLADSRGVPREVRKAIEEAATYSESRMLRVRSLADDEDIEDKGS